MMYLWIPVLGVLLGLASVECSEFKKLWYGDDLSLRVPKEAAMLEFSSRDQQVVLWSQINAANERGARGTVEKGYWKAKRMTPNDAGKFSFLRESGDVISSTVVTVKGQEETDYISDDTEHWHVNVRVPAPEVKVIYFYPGYRRAEMETVLFVDGVHTHEAFEMFGASMQVNNEGTYLTFNLMSVYPGSAGRYDFLDKDNHLVKRVYLEGPQGYQGVPAELLIMAISITLGVLIGLTCCCWCCCKLCSDDGDKAETTAASPVDTEPPIHVHGPLQMTGPSAPLQPPASASSSDNTNQLQASSVYPPNPWANSPPPHAPDPVPSTYLSPPPYVPYQAPSDERAGESLSNPPTASLDLGPQYEMRSWGGGMDDFLSSSPLCMDSSTTEGATYSSDKLKF